MTSSSDIRTAFQGCFGRPAVAVARAPGRLEILGNHTDYNEGVVLSMAVESGTWFAAAPRPGTACKVRDLRSGETRTFDLTALANPKPKDWANYIKGMVVELTGRGLAVPAFDAVVQSTLPTSAGMASSAAFEMAAGLALTQLAGVELPWLELARAGQACENRHVGARTGLLDQFSSLRGEPNCLVFSDFRSLAVRAVPLPAGVALVVANSLTRHALIGEYNERRTRCEEAVAFLRAKNPGIRVLRDVSVARLEAAKPEMAVMAWRRARHVVGENERVFAGVEALQRGDLCAFGKLLDDSHESSRIYFENSCPELDILVACGQALPGHLGARLSGGGFGGITVHLVREAEAAAYAERLATAFQTRTGRRPETTVCHAAAGAARL